VYLASPCGEPPKDERYYNIYAVRQNELLLLNSAISAVLGLSIGMRPRSVIYTDVGEDTAQHLVGDLAERLYGDPRALRGAIL
jgi:hypothetical protein